MRNLNALIVSICYISFFLFQLTPLAAMNRVGHLRVTNGVLTDSTGRTLILNGLNHVNKNPSDNYLHADDEALFKKFKSWGFNLIRYGIIWDGLEPEPGVINETYLKEIDKRVKWAEENDLWLMLDMHQDLYGQEFSDGAPAWATLTKQAPHHTGAIWSDSYLISPAVHSAFDSFWENLPASDGVGIQDHYINLWQIIAERYKDSPAVLGFDVMNEPFPGSQANEVLGGLLTAASQLLYETEGISITESEIMTALSDPISKGEAFSFIATRNNYQKLLRGAEQAVAHFEKGVLSGFYQKVRDAIRSVNQKQMILLEHSYFCNLGFKSAILPPSSEQGVRDQLVLFAPHGYDFVTDTDLAAFPSTERVDYIFESIFMAGKEKQLPTILGEWGAFYLGDRRYLTPAKQIMKHIEQNLAGQTYWCYWNGIEKQDYFPILSRIYPMRTAGQLMDYKNHFEEGKYTMQWYVDEASLQKETLIYIPDYRGLDCSIFNNDSFHLELEKGDGESEAYLRIRCKRVGEQNLLLLYK